MDWYLIIYSIVFVVYWIAAGFEVFRLVKERRDVHSNTLGTIARIILLCIFAIISYNKVFFYENIENINDNLSIENTVYEDCIKNINDEQLCKDRESKFVEMVEAGN